jgi:8-oxo-dGTP pyrophosphatase MutT (NUDIX family)
VSTGPSTPRDAATVLLLRDSPDGIQVWLMRRRDDLAFAPGAFVFPGGAVVTDPADAHGWGWDGPSPEALAVSMGTDTSRAMVLIEAAVRELFEESGVLLARGPSSSTTSVSWGEVERTLLLNGTATLTELLAREELVVATDVLVPWAWWLTPEWSPRRYDTWFFAVDAAAWPEPQHVVDGEAVESGWFLAESVLRAERAVPGRLLPPTLEALERLVDAGTVSDALAAAPPALSRRSG